MKKFANKIFNFMCLDDFKTIMIKLLTLSFILFCGYLFNPFIYLTFAIACIFILCEKSVNSITYLLYFISSTSLFTFKNSYGLNFWVLLVCVFVLVNGIKYIVLLCKKEKQINKPLLIMIALLAVWFAIPIGRDYKILSVLESFVWLAFFYIVIDDFKNININMAILSAGFGFLYSSFAGLFVGVIPYLKNNIIIYYSGNMKRFSGSLNNPNVFYCIGLVVTSSILTQVLNKRLSLWWLLLEIPVLIFAYMAVSKTFILAGVVIAVLAVISTCIKNSKFKWKTIGSMALIVLLVCVTMFPYTKEYYNRFFHSTSSDSYVDENMGSGMQGGTEDNKGSDRGLINLTTGRVEIWKAYFKHFKEENKFLTGFGINTAYGYLPNNTHNTYLQVLYETGIIGVLLILACVVVYLRNSQLKVFKKLNTAWFLPWAGLAVVAMAENLFLSQLGNMLLLLSILSLNVVEDAPKESLCTLIARSCANSIPSGDMVAILTPSYNREELLEEAYQSLEKQTNKSFVWYIVDDGSVESQQQAVENIAKRATFKVVYNRKDNGGKHTAVNYGMQKITEPLTIILDNDDKLRSDAVDTILKDYQLIKDNPEICGLGYLKTDKNGQVVGVEYTADGVVDTFINQRYNKKTFGDKCEVFKTEILKNYPFPEIKGERFLSETIVWCQMSGKYKMVFFNDGIYICEYRQGGLSDGVKKTLFNNPKGATLVYNSLTTKDFNLGVRVKNVLLYIIHSFASGNSALKTIKMANAKTLTFFLIPVGRILYLNRKRRFKSDS